MNDLLRVLVIGPGKVELAIGAGLAASRDSSLAAALSRTDSLEAALDRLRNDGKFDLVICDLDAGPGIIASLRKSLDDERIVIPILACSTAQNPDLAVEAIVEGATDFLSLPPDAMLISAMLRAAVERSHAILAVDPTSRSLLRQTERIAMSDASVLIVGESGTGKEVIARHLHRSSRRRSEAFIAVNCAAIPDALLESELFGHEKGAFSGAVARRIGKFEAASSGTLLLDEISEMDLRLQAKLLRALQEREIDRVGGSGPVRIDTRIVATSNRDLKAEVASGRFRADLYFRLNVVGLHLVPLRERRHDIVPLARHYLARYAETNGLPLRPLSLSAVEHLEAYRWPGNVRELENAMHRAVLLADGMETGPEAFDFVSDLRPRSAPENPSRSGLPRSFVGRTVEHVEQALIIETLKHTLGNRTHAAALLGISIRALRNKLRDYTAQGVSVPSPDFRAAV